MAHLPALGGAEAGHIGDHGLGHGLLIYPAASISCGPPISPISTTAWVSGSLEDMQHVQEGAAIDWIAADTDAGGDADAEAFICEAAS